VGPKKVPMAVTHDSRTIRFVHPEIKANDTLRVNIQTGEVIDYVKFENGNLVMITGGHNVGRVGTIVHREKHPGSFEIVHIKDAKDRSFATRISNVFVIGKGSKPWVSLPKNKGIRSTMMEDRVKRISKLGNCLNVILLRMYVFHMHSRYI